MSSYGSDLLNASRLALQWEQSKDGRSAWAAWQIARRYPGDYGMREVLERIAPFIDGVAAAVLALDGQAVKRPEPWRKAVGLAGHARPDTRRKVQAAAWSAFHREIASAIVEGRSPAATYGKVLSEAASRAKVSERTARTYMDETALRDLPKPQIEAAPAKALRKCAAPSKPASWRAGSFSKKR
jgi:hypothetical protein